MPTRLPEGLTLAGITAREDPRDALLISAKHYDTTDIPDSSTTNNTNSSAAQVDLPVSSCRYKSLASLPPGAVVGTSSLRREAMIRRLYPHLTVATIRGNLNTRLRKLDQGVTPEGVGAAASGPSATAVAAAAAAASDIEGAVTSPATVAATGSSNGNTSSNATHGSSAQPSLHYDALVLAAAGVKRMGWGRRIVALLSPSDQPHAAGQGALGLECRADDGEVLALCRAITHVPSAIACLAERAFLNRLQGGCQAPIAVQSVWDWQGEGHWQAKHEAEQKQQQQEGGGGPLTAEDASPYPAVGTLTLRGTVTSVDGSAEVAAVCSDVFELAGGVAGAAKSVGVRRPAAAVSTSSSSSVPAPVAVASGPGDFPWCPRLSVHQWEGMHASATLLGAAVARKSVSAGADAILGPLTAPRAATYGAAEQPLDR